MANDNESSAPLITPEAAQVLVESGQLSQETAAPFLTKPVTSNVPPADDVGGPNIILSDSPGVPNVLPPVTIEPGSASFTIPDVTQAPAITPQDDAQARVDRERERLQAYQPMLPVSPGVGMGLNVAPPVEITEEQAIESVLEQQAAVPTQQEVLELESASDEAIINTFNAQNEKRIQAGLAAKPAPPEVQAAIDRQNIKNDAVTSAVLQQPVSNFVNPDALNASDEPKTAYTPSPVTEGTSLQDIYQETIEANKRYEAERENLRQQQEAKQKAEEAAAQERFAVFENSLTASKERVAELVKQREEYQKTLDKDNKEKGLFGIKSGWGQALAAISVGLSGYAAGMLGGENQALKILNQAMDRDIEEQKFKIKNFGEAIDAERGIYSDLYREYKDERLATIETKRVQNEQFQLKIEEMAQRYANQTARTNAKIMIEQLKQQQRDLEQQRQVQMYVLHLKQNGETLTAGEMDRLAMIAPKEEEEMRSRWVPGAGFVADKEDRRRVMEYRTETNGAIKTLEGIKNMGVDFWKNPKAARYFQFSNEVETQVALAVGKLRIPVTGGGPLTEPERKLLTDIQPNPAKLFTFVNQKEKAEAFISALRIQRLSVEADAGIESSYRELERIKKERLAAGLIKPYKGVIGIDGR